MRLSLLSLLTSEPLSYSFPPSYQGLPIGARYTLPENETEMNARLRKLARLEAQKWMI